MPTINELAMAAGELNRSMNVKAGLNPQSPVIFGLASGLDIALTIFESSTDARISEMSHQSAARVVKYLYDEAKRSEAVDSQISFFYLSWARVISAAFVPP